MQFLAEGWNSVDAAIQTDVIKEVFVTERALDDERYARVVSDASDRGIRVSLITDRAAQSLADTVTNAGLFALCRSVVGTFNSFREILAAKRTDSSEPALVVVGVDTSDPGNAGTIIRIADAMGADGVIFAGETVDPENGKVVRSSAGSIFHLPVVRDRDVTSVIESLKGEGIQLLATAADGAVNIEEADELLAGSTAWLLGNEAHGLSSEVAGQADFQVRIPIRGRAESLNLAAATSICLYASARAQKRSSRV